jgi:hypothetical protein
MACGEPEVRRNGLRISVEQKKLKTGLYEEDNFIADGHADVTDHIRTDRITPPFI